MTDVLTVPLDDYNRTRSQEAAQEALDRSYVALAARVMPDPADVNRHVRACAQEGRAHAVAAVAELLRFLGYDAAADVVEGA